MRSLLVRAALGLGLVAAAAAVDPATADAGLRASSAAPLEAAETPCETGEALERQGLWWAANAAFEDAIADGNDCTAQTIEYVRVRVRFSSLLLGVAFAHRRMGEPLAAGALLLRVQAIDPSDPRPAEALAAMASADRERARIERLQREGFEEAAQERLQAYLVDHPDDPAGAGVSGIAQPAWWQRIADALREFFQAIWPGILALVLVAISARVIIARVAKRRLVLAPIAGIGERSDDAEEQASEATQGEDAKLGASSPPAAGPEGLVLAPGAIESLLASELRRIRTDETTVDVTIASGPEEAVDLPEPTKLPAQLAPLAVVSLLLPAQRTYTVSANLLPTSSGARLAVRMVRGRLDRGEILDAVVLESEAAVPREAEEELAGKAAAWVAFAWAELRGSRSFMPGGTKDWNSYACFLSGLAHHRQMSKDPSSADALARRRQAIKWYMTALRRDASNINALVNLASINVEDDPSLAITHARRAQAVLGAGKPDGTTLATTDPLAWNLNWYRAMAHDATASVNARILASPDSVPAPTDEISTMVQRAETLVKTTQSMRLALDTAERARTLSARYRRWRARRGASGLHTSGLQVPEGAPDPGPGFAAFLDRLDVAATVVLAATHVEGRDVKAAKALVGTDEMGRNPHTAYNLACTFARMDEVDETLRFLREATAAYPGVAWSDPSFDRLRKAQPKLFEEVVGPRPTPRSASQTRPEVSSRTAEGVLWLSRLLERLARGQASETVAR